MAFLPFGGEIITRQGWAGIKPLPWLVIPKVPLSAEKGLNLDILPWQKWGGIAVAMVSLRIIIVLNYHPI